MTLEEAMRQLPHTQLPIRDPEANAEMIKKTQQFQRLVRQEHAGDPEKEVPGTTVLSSACENCAKRLLAWWNKLDPIKKQRVI